MALAYPWSLAALAVVAAVAAWAYFRPGSQLVVVPSLWLWRQAAETAHRDSRRSRRRVSPSWLLLLGGAVAATLAGARPVVRSHVPARSVTLVLYPSAEIASDAGIAELRGAATALLGRLDASDRVQLLVPVSADARTDQQWLSPAQARSAVESLRPLPVPTGSLSFPPASEQADHVYHIAASLGVPSGGRSTTISLAPQMGPASLDALAASPANGNEGSPARVDVLVGVANHLKQNWTGRVVLSAASVGADGKVTLRRLWEAPMTIAPQGRSQAVVSREAAAAFVVALEDGSPTGAVRQGFLARRPRRPLTVALTGRDEPLLRKFVRAHGGLEPAAEADRADVVIANGVDPPANRPALVIAPPHPPAGWQADEGQNLALAGANADQADPLLRGVDMTRTAVRRSQTWTATDLAPQTPVVSWGGKALVLRDEPRGTDQASRRVWVGFDLSADNTNFALSRSFPIFLANAVEFLAGKRPATESYEAVPPDRADVAWRAVVAGSSDRPAWPGLYADPAGQLHAVSLAGARTLSARLPDCLDALEQVRRAPLPPSRPVGREVELWWLLAGLAMAAWLAGWALRVR